VGDVVTCKRCADLIAAKAADLVLLWSPDPPGTCRTALWYEREGEKVRTLAIAMHAAEGHPA
jgi:hypothetical protein